MHQNKKATPMRISSRLNFLTGVKSANSRGEPSRPSHRHHGLWDPSLRAMNAHLLSDIGFHRDQMGVGHAKSVRI
jgi:hypothetical protein